MKIKLPKNFKTPDLKDYKGNKNNLMQIVQYILTMKKNKRLKRS